MWPPVQPRFGGPPYFPKMHNNMGGRNGFPYGTNPLNNYPNPGGNFPRNNRDFNQRRHQGERPRGNNYSHSTPLPPPPPIGPLTGPSNPVNLIYNNIIEIENDRANFTKMPQD